MRFSPPMLSGHLYPKPTRLGCTAYNHCYYCFQCKAFDPHSATCTYCESRKDGKHCDCSDKKIATVKMLEEKMGRPYYNVNAAPSSIEREEVLMSTSFNQENQMIVEELTK